MRNDVAVLFLLASYFCVNVFAALTIEVAPGTAECFAVFADAGQLVQANFWVTRGGMLDIDLRVTAPHEVLLYSGVQSENGQYSFTAKVPGSYQFCWNNEMTRWTAKVVQFEITVGATEDSPFITHDALTPMAESIYKIDSILEKIEADQMYLKIREQRHRDTAESTNERVMWYSIFESFVLISLALGQVYYLRKLFNVKGQYR
eukprot:TRINITY_DN31334_c0_g1_i1.p1 TRINITY_DN31334_c0_g1~~TRINITY_DN31334_c0_g1_i1.p1  ORF type:complete len:204 (+),score=39.08 TRINITY_DN31334_c0_g1_i1:91-702(+)